MDLNATSQALGLFVQFATTVTLLYALYKFARKPNESQDQRIEKCENRLDEIDRRLDKGSDHFDSIDRGHRVTQEAILALIDHAIDNNHTDKLIEAKDNLQKYLINK